MLRTVLAPQRANNNSSALPAVFGDLSGVYAGFDRIQFWLRTPLTRDEIAAIKKAGVAQIITFRERARFDPRYCRRMVVTVPSLTALAVLRDLREPKDYLLNIVEPGASINFNDDADRMPAFWFVARTWVKANHRDQGVRFVGEGDRITRYSGPAHARTVDALYPDRPCRFTGEVSCLHPDRRIRGADACRAAGIETFQDLIDFDHVEFWRSNFKLYEIDPRRLGRLYSNRQSRQRRRIGAVIERGNFRYDVDLRVGAALMRAAGNTNQEVLDRYRRVLPVRRAFKSVDIEPLLTLLALDKCNN